MLLQCCTSLNFSALSSQNNFVSTLSDPKNQLSYYYSVGRFRNPRRTYKSACVLKVGLEDIAEVIHNKLLIAAGVSAAIGQLSKPFTGSLLYGRDFDLKATFQAGGFPSTHSSSVVAAATCLALERGFSDSFFGLTVVYAGLVMYDARGVRREVGLHAKTLNNLLFKTQVNSRMYKDKDGAIDGEGASSTLKLESLDPLLAQKANSFVPQSANDSPLLLKSDKNERQIKQMFMSSGLSDDMEGPERSADNSAMLKESIGHTEVEVVAGALLGFFVSLVVSSVM
ncbi:Acid phosphatase/vanadium-dependent haloperoxidase-related protein [Melia azedarach]|uniref:Acid phosphatase/vanadium-dependent haloperoxidase-related protein n=1 Tax=Melia azedarach TaxID=155640 RepID=A0ACC1X515_MELAZ|nr:Acid phosphatase/vanadium-dependent haloperoxidase-related protein [Melia azedarach]